MNPTHPRRTGRAFARAARTTPTDRHATRLRCEPLEAREVPAVTVLDQLIGGSLDASLLADGTLTADECIGNQTISRGILATVSALANISITSPDGIAFGDQTLPLVLPTLAGRSASFVSLSGGISFLDPTDSIATAGGALSFVAPGGNVALGALTASGVSVVAGGTVSVGSVTAPGAGTIALQAGGALTVNGPLSTVLGTVALAAPTLNINLTGVTAPALTLGGGLSLSLGALGTVSLSGVNVLNATGGTVAVTVDLAARGYQNGSAPDEVSVSTTAGGVLNVTARDGGTGAPTTLFSGAASGVGSLTLNGSSDRESFLVDHTHAGVPALFVNGGGPTVGPGDALTVTGATGATAPGAPGAGTITFTGRNTITFTGIENTAAVAVSVAATDDAAAEHDAGQTPNPGRFTLTRTGDTATGLTVSYTVGGTGVAGSDYQVLTGTATFAPGSATTTVDVTALNNAVLDGSRTVSLAVAAGTGYNPVGGAAVVTIADNDSAGPATPPGTTGAGGPGSGRSGAGARPAATRIATGSANGEVALFDRGSGAATFRIPSAVTPGATAVAVGDVDGDGIADIVSVVASGGPAQVRVFDGATGAERLSFLALPAAVRTGASVAVGDLNGDGRAEIIVSTTSVVPAVLVFDGESGARVGLFLAHSGGGGVRVAAGDVDGDGMADIITAGTGTNPRIGVFDMSGNSRYSFPAFAPLATSSALTVGTADLDGDGKAEVLVGVSVGGANWVVTFSGTGAMRSAASFPAVPSTVGVSGPPVAGSDVDGDGREEVLVCVGPFIGVLDGTSLAVKGVMQPHAGAGGIYVG